MSAPDAAAAAAAGGTSERRAPSWATSSPACARESGSHANGRRPPEPVTESAMPTFHEYASAWLAGKRQGVLGDKPIDANTESDYRWRLSRHLLPYFAAHPPRPDRRRALPRVQEPQAPGGDRDPRRARRRRRPAGPPRASAAAAVGLVDPQADRHARRDPRRRHRGRAHRPQPRARQAHARAGPEAGADLPRDGRARRGDRRRRRPGQLADDRRPDPRLRARDATSPAWPPPAGGPATSRPSSGSPRRRSRITSGRSASSGAEPYAGRRAIVETLGRSGVRVSELCDLRVGELRLHDRDNGRFGIPDAKTEAGIREVQMSPDLVDRLTEHLTRLRAAGQPTGPDAYAFPNLRGGRISRQRVGKILREAAVAASDAPAGARPAAASDHDAAHAAAHLHLDRAARQRLRRQVGHEPGRPRRLEDDARRLRPARAARRALPRHVVRRPPPRRERPPAGR